MWYRGVEVVSLDVDQSELLQAGAQQNVEELLVLHAVRPDLADESHVDVEAIAVLKGETQWVERHLPEK